MLANVRTQAKEKMALTPADPSNMCALHESQRQQVETRFLLRTKYVSTRKGQFLHAFPKDKFVNNNNKKSSLILTKNRSSDLDFWRTS